LCCKNRELAIGIAAKIKDTALRKTRKVYPKAKPEALTKSISSGFLEKPNAMAYFCMNKIFPND
jgi:hypothetical protein